MPPTYFCTKFMSILNWQFMPAFSKLKQILRAKQGLLYNKDHIYFHFDSMLLQSDCDQRLSLVYRALWYHTYRNERVGGFISL